MKLKVDRAVVSNGIWSISALAILQSTLQLIVYPNINKRIGAEEFGNVLYIMALISIFAPAIGNALGNVKLMDKQSVVGKNGDFLLSLGLQTVFSVLLVVALCNSYIVELSNWILLVLVFGLNVFRCYGETTYRIQLDFKGYFFYYFLLSVGYFLGVSLLVCTNRWMLCFLTGELFCVLLSLRNNGLFYPLSVSTQWRMINKQSALLMVSYVLNNSIGFLDRIFLQHWIDGRAVSIYYVASLFGKIVIMIIVPLNNLLFSYLVRENFTINDRKYVILFLSVIFVGMVLYIGIMIVSPVFVKLFYSELYEFVYQILWITSLSQIFCAVTSTLLIILLKIYGIKWQFYFQLLYFIQYTLLCAVGSKLGGVEGFSIGGAISNAIQLMFVLCVGLLLIGEVKRNRKK